MKPTVSTRSARFETQSDDRRRTSHLLNVLLVDSDRKHAGLIHRMINEPLRNEFQLQWSASFESGMQLLDDETFDVVLVDLMLPGCSMLESLVCLCNSHPHVPVVVVTAIEDEELSTMALQKGAQDYLIKGRFGSDVLRRSLRYAIERQRRLHAEQQVQRAEENERARLSRDLHDGVIQTVAAMRLEMQLLATKLQRHDADAAKAVNQLAGNANSAIEEIRQVAHDLHPTTLDGKRLIDVIRWHTERLEHHGGPQIEVQGRGSFSRNAKEHLYRICQEGLRNAIKHGKASRVRITVEGDAHQVMLRIADNGQGFDPDATRSANDGMGLHSICERANLMGGKVVIDSVPGEGTTVTVSAPAFGTVGATSGDDLSRRPAVS